MDRAPALSVRGLGLRACEVFPAWQVQHKALPVGNRAFGSLLLENAQFHQEIIIHKQL